MGRRNLRSLRRKKEKKQVRLLVLPPLLALLAAAGIFLFVRYSVPLREIVFVGNSHLKNEELKSLVRVKENDKLFAVPGRRIYANLRRSPWIKEAVIRRELSGRMLIRVTEGVPIAILSIGGVPYLIDSDGNTLEQMKDGTVLFLPVIKEIDPEKNREAYGEAVRFANILHDRRVLAYEGNMEITGARPEDIALKVDAIAIRIGAGDFQKKLERLESIKDEIQKRNMTIEYIDLRFANKIIVKPAGNAGPAEALAAAGEPAGGAKR